LLVGLCAALAVISSAFAPGEALMTRPIVPMTCLLLAMGGLYAVFARKAIADPPPLKVMLLVALVTRAILIPSFPIQESDLYRYLWDGRVVAAGMDPYRFSPEEIDRFEQGGAAASADDITEKEKPLSAVTGLIVSGKVDKWIVLQTGSGNYHFSTHL